MLGNNNKHHPKDLTRLRLSNGTNFHASSHPDTNSTTLLFLLACEFGASLTGRERSGTRPALERMDQYYPPRTMHAPRNVG